jgi:surfeit locus 1 family protein
VYDAGDGQRGAGHPTGGVAAPPRAPDPGPPSPGTGPPSAARILLRPRWVSGHLTVLLVVAIFVALGFWQLGRAHHKENLERAAKAAYAAPAPALLEAGSEQPSGTRVEVRGSYDPAPEVLLRGRVHSGASGYDILTPLRLDDGSAVLVDRGWVSRPDAENGTNAIEPRSGRVTVRGTIAEPRALNPDDTVDERGGRTTLPRVDIARVGADVSYPLRDVYIAAQFQDPAPANGVPALPEPPAPDDVNHYSYTFQWFAFALIPLIGWPIVLSRVIKKERTGNPE